MTETQRRMMAAIMHGGAAVQTSDGRTVDLTAGLAYAEAVERNSHSPSDSDEEGDFSDCYWCGPIADGTCREHAARAWVMEQAV